MAIRQLSDPTDPTESSLTQRAALFLGWLAFVLACFYYGSQINLVLFTAMAAAVLLGLSLLGPETVIARLAGHRFALMLVILSLLALVVGHQWSLSRDSSYAPAWGLAMAPLGFMLARGLGDRRQILYLALGATVLVFAMISVWQLLTAGYRAHLPLGDPNNYGCLLYLVLLPWMHHYIIGCWRARQLQHWQHVASYAAITVLMLALFATQSRTSGFIVLAAGVVWLSLVLWRRLPVRPLAVFLVLGLASFALAGFLLGGESNGVDEELASGFAVRWELLTSALEMFVSRPLTGIGIYVFPLLYRQYRSPLDQDTAGRFVHNDFVQFLTEGGPLLALALVAFTVAIVVFFVRSYAAEITSKRFGKLGLVLGLGAAVAHALLNFVFYIPVLAFVIGVSAALLYSDEVVAAKVTPEYRTAGWLALGLGWIAWSYLALDTFVLGVFQPQPSVPFARYVAADPDRSLKFARLAQNLNEDRGLPVLAQAVLLEQKLNRDPASEYLLESTLASYRDAAATDPWNPYVFLQMYRFVTNHPSVTAKLGADERPDELLIRVVSLDPVSVQGIDSLLAHFRGSQRAQVADTFLRERVAPWLIWLARMDKSSSQRYLVQLQQRWQDDPEFMKALAVIEAQVDAMRPKRTKRWLF